MVAFVLEKNMTPIIQNNIQDILSNINLYKSEDSALLALELPVQYRMIDVAVAIIDRNDKFIFEDYAQVKPFKNLNSIAIDILSMFCIYKKATIFFLSKQLGLNNEDIKKYLLKLTKLRLIDQVSKYTYKVLDWINVTPKSIISIELKLSKWQEALEQGTYNLKFSNYSFVALDEDQIPNSKNIEKYFIENNVGLIYVNSDGYARAVYVPEKNKNINSYMCNFQRIKVLKDMANKNKKWDLIRGVE